MRKEKWIIPSLFLLVVLSACGIMEKKEQTYVGDFDFEIADFTYTNQNNEPVSLEELKGEFWVADFIFTNCNTVCPPMTGNMARLQQQLKEENLDVQLISFSVDPTVDTPAVLKEFGDKYTQDYSNWNFLTGYTQEEIESFAAESFYTLVTKADGNEQVGHGTSFYLVAPNGHAIKRYDGTKAASMQEIVQDIKTYKNQ
ncbi:protein SCO1/2 [Salirhabdus euzebyi]|uniref:Protein SCO1/2 n=1 Tax=Salirhabdus euzebyi TaxID=394506 RepID=A0A841Q8X3_9BACI|nr:SCO family protein [Salirhabdus euzebyi]MBB6454850.1 protein SCO1/2 [Salirhabdus euzebyi]